MKKVKIFNRVGLLFYLGMLITLNGCAPHEMAAPCNNYGQHCDPKVWINQWTPTQINSSR